ncbi:MAG: dTDP-4-dehydrorhamnose 3,5-epimerase [Parvibaculaceae bacterium]
MASLDVERLELPEIAVVTPKRFGDSRGYFEETYNRQVFRTAGIAADFVQDNQSLSQKRGTIRGLHFQAPPHAQAKLVRVLAGSIFDVAVDIRRDSERYGRWCGAVLSAENGKQLFVPRGFAHAFCTLEPNTIVAYKVDALYSGPHDGGLRFDDPQIGIDWPVAANDVMVSEKDRNLPFLKAFQSPFTVSNSQ